jgi:FkbM family methyltransferase
MAFENVAGILRMGSPAGSLKLLLIAASASRPRYRRLCLALLRPFSGDGEVELTYRCYGVPVRALIRLSDLHSDLLSIRELGIGDTYDLDMGFRPDLVIDGGGNIGLFTLRAAAASSAGNISTKFVVCEPLPRNVAQIEKHLAMNGVQAEILAGCLGGEHRSIPFYCRDAIDSSFDPRKPYAGVIDIPVYTLEDAMKPGGWDRMLIKLDIEGMEIEVLERFVPGETRAVYLVGELHSFALNSPTLERVFRDHGWTFEYRIIADDHANFRACSPAALPLLASMRQRTPD